MRRRPWRPYIHGLRQVLHDALKKEVRADDLWEPCTTATAAASRL